MQTNLRSISDVCESAVVVRDANHTNVINQAIEYHCPHSMFRWATYVEEHKLHSIYVGSHSPVKSWSKCHSEKKITRETAHEHNSSRRNMRVP